MVSDLLADAVEDRETFTAIREQQRGGLNMITRADPRHLPQRNESLEIPVAADEVHVFDHETGEALR